MCPLKVLDAATLCVGRAEGIVLCTYIYDVRFNAQDELTYSTYTTGVAETTHTALLIGRQDSAVTALAKFIDGLSKSDKIDFRLDRGKESLPHEWTDHQPDPTNQNKRTDPWLAGEAWLGRCKFTMFPRVCPPV